MIAVKLMGGLGNQMFQYATAKQLAKLRNTDVLIDGDWFNNQASIDTPRAYELNLLKINAKFKKNHVRSSNNLWTYKNKFLNNFSTVFNEYQEASFNYNDSVLKLPDKTFLSGYFQTEKYFLGVRNELLLEFVPGYTLNDNVNNYLNKIRESLNSVSLHIRRGDYIKNENASKFHGAKGVEYYNLAVKKMVDILNCEVDLFIFSDDIDWCKSNLKFDLPTNYIDCAKVSFDDMWLMSHCRHNIIANSSFSWWGAWLNNNHGKNVIAPMKWFNDTSVNTNDILPKTWIKL